LDATLDSFPLYRSVLRRGVFWYYLEGSEIQPKVTPENKRLCAPLYIKEKKSLLFRVSYFKQRINLEVFHALSDGTGALWFMQTLIHHYIINKYNTEFGDNLPQVSYFASLSEKMDDSFNRHFNPLEHQKGKIIRPKAYHIKGSKVEAKGIKLIEGSMSVKETLNMAHKYNTTLTIFITALMIYSIYKVMPKGARKNPVVLSVPINLRQFFESVTARNFFSTMNIAYHFKNNTDFTDIIKVVEASFKENLTQEQIDITLNKFMTLERNPFARVIPLPLKDISLKIGNYIKDKETSAALSNVGKVTMPTSFEKYIKQFSVFYSARRPHLCMCSYGDRLVITFASPFKETEIQRYFFNFLTSNGIEVEISSNPI
jgi:hypothetical protein